MSPLPPPDRAHRARRRGDTARGLAALTALVVFLVGVPLALSVVAPLGWPGSWPTWDSLSAALTRPDDGGLLLGTITLVAWGAWAAFAISAATEIVAGIRHVSAPSIPLLRMTQRAAATLIATAGLLVTSTTPTLPTAAAAPRALMAVAVPADGTDGAPATSGMTAAMTQRSGSMTGSSRAMTDGVRAMTPAASPQVSPPPTSVEAAGPVITVMRGDTLWGLAERHLGDGRRYVEIYDLNAGRSQADGRALTDAHWIYPGWRLRLPVGATDVPAAPPATPTDDLGPTTAEQAVHEVVPGDTLWDISSDHLGDGARYPEIYDLNVGRPQPDGRTLTDPDLIYPGWQLDLPIPVVDPARNASVAMPRTSEATADPSESFALPEAQAEGRDQKVSPDHAAPPNLEAAPDDAPRANAASNGASDDAPAPADDDAPLPLGQFFFGLTALAAAGVIGELARRRHLQHRTRRTGARISLPAPGSRADDAERTLRSAATPLTMAQMKAALLNLATRCYAAERDLPRVGTLLLNGHNLELHLVEDDSEPVEPFAATGPRTWSASTASLAEDGPLDDDLGRPEPYPALVTLGHNNESTVIINLEAAGTLTVNGDPDAARAVLRAVVAELATGDLAGRVGLITGPEFAGLAGASDSARLQCVDPATHAAMHSQRHQAASELLSAAGVEDTLQARSDRTAEDLWLPVIYLAEPHAPDAAWARVTPWSGSALLTTSAWPGAWTLNVGANGSSTLEPPGDRLFAQRLTTTDLERLTDLLATATPAPDAAGIVGAARAVANDITDALAALPAATTPPGQPSGREGQGLRIKVLGSIEIEELRVGEKPLSKRSTELLVYLALRGKATGSELDEALWHGRRVDNQTRNSLVYRTRQRVGADALPLVNAEGLYRLGPDVTCDWEDFRTHAHEGLAAGHAGLDELRAAFDLVRNRPFLGIAGADYTWAEHDIQQMSSAIADVAHVLSQLLRESGDDRLALEVATKGLLVEPYAEALQADATRAAQAGGDTDEAERLDSRFAALLSELDPDFAG
jgi:nucleoid-associated protein YgaU/DNA-binding SARP family transcriptional activator